MLLQIGTMMLTLLLVIHPLSLMESSPGFHSGFFFGSSWGKVSLSPASLLRRLHRPRRPQQPLHPQHPLRRHQRAPQHRQPLERTCSRTKDRPRRIASRAISSSGPTSIRKSIISADTRITDTQRKARTCVRRTRLDKAFAPPRMRSTLDLVQ